MMGEVSILQLRVEAGEKKGQVIDSKGRSKITVGRHGGWNSFVLKDNAISQKHLLFHFQDGLWTLLDLQSSNGTILNNLKLPPNTPHHLKNGDVIKIGVDSVLRVVLEKETVTTQTQNQSTWNPETMTLGMWFDDMEQWLEGSSWKYKVKWKEIVASVTRSNPWIAQG